MTKIGNYIYQKNFVYLGFINHRINGEDRPQCFFCCQLYSNGLLKTSRLEEHFESKHENEGKKSKEYYKDKAKTFEENRIGKKIKQVPTNTIKLISYYISYQIALLKQPYTLAEQLIKLCLSFTVEKLFGKPNSHTIDQMPLSPNTIKSRTIEMGEDINKQLITKLSNSINQFFLYPTRRINRL